MTLVVWRFHVFCFVSLFPLICLENEMQMKADYLRGACRSFFTSCFPLSQGHSLVMCAAIWFN